MGEGGGGNMAHNLKPVNLCNSCSSDLLKISDMHLYNFMISFRRKNKKPAEKKHVWDTASVCCV